MRRPACSRHKSQNKRHWRSARGWASRPRVAALIGRLFSTVTCPAVFDADALNALASSPAPFCARKRLRDDVFPRVLTPHPGEFARLAGTDVPTVQKNREGMAIDFAAQYQVVLVLKGHKSVHHRWPPSGD